MTANFHASGELSIRGSLLLIFHSFLSFITENKNRLSGGGNAVASSYGSGDGVVSFI